MEQEQYESKNFLLTRRWLLLISIISVIIISTAAIVYFTLKQKNHKIEIVNTASIQQKIKENPIEKFESLPNNFLEQKYKQNDLNTLSSANGFSLKYPLNDVQATFGREEKFQAAFIFSRSLVSAEDDDVIGKLGADLGEMDIDGALNMKVFNFDESSNFNLWTNDLMKEEKSFQEDEGVELSRESGKILLANLEGLMIVRKMEFGNSQLSLHLVYEDIFIHKDGIAYRFSFIAPSEDTTFPRSGTIGNEYLQQVENISMGIIKTLTFDGSSMSAIGIPKNKQPEIVGDEYVRREQLLDALRKEPFIDEKKTYQLESSRKQCKAGTTSSGNKSSYSGALQPSSGIYFGADKDNAQLHAFDEKGGHTGPIPTISEFESDNFIEERALGFNSIRLGGIGYGIAMHENMPGRIEIVGKSYSFTEFAITGDGNSCDIARMYLPTTPFSVYTLSTNANGEYGPLSGDIDGDGMEDFKLSLKYPLLPGKQLELMAVVEDMKNNNMPSE